MTLPAFSIARPIARGIAHPIAAHEGAGAPAWVLAGAALDLNFAEAKGYNSIDLSKRTPDSILTYTSPSPKMVCGEDGLLQYAPHNLARYGTDPSDSNVWAINNGGTLEGNVAVGPRGGLTATRVTFTAFSYHRQTDLAVVPGFTYTFSFYAMRDTGTDVCLSVYDYSNFADIVAPTSYFSSINSDTWSRVSVTFTAPAGCTAIAIYPQRDTPSAGSVLVSDVQLNRGSVALEYVPTDTAAAYSLPIDHDPVTHEALGVLIEEQRTNLLTYSEQFDNAAWTKQEATVSANTSITPNGTTTADTLVSSTSGGTGYARYYASVTVTGVPHTYSTYVKAGTANFVYFTTSGFDAGADGTTWFNLATGEVGTTSPNHTNASIQSVGNGWYRCSLTFSTVTDLVGLIFTGMATANNTTSVNRDGTVNILLWGAQLEAGAFPTSYIPTVASQVTRAEDTIRIETSDFAYSATSSTFYCEAGFLSSSVFNTSNRAIFELGDGGSSNRALLLNSGTGAARVIVTTTGGSGLDITDSVVLGNSVFKAAFGVDTTGGLAVDGALSGTDSNSVPPVGPTRLLIGRAYTAGTQIDGHIKRLTYFPTRKSNAELQALAA